MARGRKAKNKKPFSSATAQKLREYNVGHSWFRASASVEAQSVPDVEESSTCSASDSEYVLRESPYATLEGVRLAEMPLLARAIQSFCVCSVCKSGAVELVEDRGQRQGLVSVCVLRCVECDSELSFPLSERQSPNHPYDLNVRTSLVMRLIGSGPSDTKTFAVGFDMPGPSNRHSLASYSNTILEAVEKVANASVRAAASELRKSVLGEAANSSSLADVAVSFDGSWSTRGFSARYGFSSVISIQSKKVLDWYTASKVCHQCQSLEASQMDKESDEWRQRKEDHDEFCMRNHAGSAKAMESDGAEVLWSRSKEEHQLRYTTFVGDGDSSSYGRVSKLQPYGPDHPVQKEDCVGHIQKRMGTGLREVLKCNKGKKLTDGKEIGGRNRLTKKRIDAFQTFYGKAIRSNVGDVQGAQDAIMAILLHSSSTDDNPQHDLCPKGDDSWCGFQQAKAAHRTYRHKHPLPQAICEILMPLFERLSSKSLLEKCSQGLTQNLNEALHSMIWRMAPKHLYHSPAETMIATACAVGMWNDGTDFVRKVLQELGMPVSDDSEVAFQKRDQERRRRLLKRSTPEWKKQEKAKRKAQLGIQDKEEEREGPVYEPGLFGPDGELMELPTRIDEVQPPAAKRPRHCRTCRGTLKGHQRGKGCPPYST